MERGRGVRCNVEAETLVCVVPEEVGDVLAKGACRRSEGHRPLRVASYGRTREQWYVGSTIHAHHEPLRGAREVAESSGVGFRDTRCAGAEHEVVLTRRSEPRTEHDTRAELRSSAGTQGPPPRQGGRAHHRTRPRDVAGIGTGKASTRVNGLILPTRRRSATGGLQVRDREEVGVVGTVLNVKMEVSTRDVRTEAGRHDVGSRIDYLVHEWKQRRENEPGRVLQSPESLSDR